MNIYKIINQIITIIRRKTYFQSKKYEIVNWLDWKYTEYHSF